MVMLTLDEDDASKFVGVDRTSGFDGLLTPKQVDATVSFPCCRAVDDEDPGAHQVHARTPRCNIYPVNNMYSAIPTNIHPLCMWLESSSFTVAKEELR
jgi:hypothetical protein